MDVVELVRELGGVAHRDDLLTRTTGYRITKALHAGMLMRVRRSWVAVPGADPARAVAAQLGGRIACITAAKERGLWVLTDDPRPHIAVPPRSSLPGYEGVRLHRTIEHVCVPAGSLLESVVDMLEHIAKCQDFELALAIWESALRLGAVSAAAVAAVRWRGRRAQELAAAATTLSDSGLESLVAARLRMWGLRVRQQVSVLGHRVDIMIGVRLVIQIDGWEFHSTAADRARDNRHDSRLRAAGYHVIRIGYAEVVGGWDQIEEEIALAVGQRVHEW